MTDGYTVYLCNGETHHYDNVVTDGVWLKCFIYRTGRENDMVVFSEKRIERYETAEAVV